MEVGLYAKRICDLVSGSAPFFVGRNGTIETEVLFFWMLHRRNKPIKYTYDNRMCKVIENNAGIFPATDSSIDAWCAEYVSALGELDGLAAGWYAPIKDIEAAILNEYCAEDVFQSPLRSLEPYYVTSDIQWTRRLAGKHVAVVSSFADTIRRQVYGFTDRIWTQEMEGLIPNDITWSFVKTGYAPSVAMGSADWPAGIDTWDKAATMVVEQVRETGATVAIIGCGGLGMIIGGRLRKHGISAIVMGGAIQVLFGIRGNRWKGHPIISNFWNASWVWPAKDETPLASRGVEGGCYWS